MKTCPFCDEKIKDDALRCKHCGHDLPIKKCPWCAEMIELEATKCRHCKSYVEKMHCAGCGKNADAEGMRCEECVASHIEEEVHDELGTERAKLELQNKIAIGIAVAAVVWAVIATM